MELEGLEKHNIYHIYLSGQNRNALSLDCIDDIANRVERANNDEHCRAIFFSAQGEFFCSGVQLQEVLERNNDILEKLSRCLRSIYSSKKATVAFVDGAVIGGGLGLVAATDIVIATKKATFQLPEVVIGMIPAVISPFLLERIPLAKLRYLAMSSKQLSAEEAQYCGLVDQISLNEEDIIEQIQRLLYSSPDAIATTKKLLSQISDKDLDQREKLALLASKEWLNEPKNIEEIRDYVDGFSPSWFCKYKRGASSQK